MDVLNLQSLKNDASSLYKLYATVMSQQGMIWMEVQKIMDFASIDFTSIQTAYASILDKVYSLNSILKNVTEFGKDILESVKLFTKFINEQSIILKDLRNIVTKSLSVNSKTINGILTQFTN